MSTIYQYEIEIETRDKRTGHHEVKTVTEYAYSVTEAGMQATINHHDNGALEVIIKRIGPPMQAVMLVAQEMKQNLDAIMKRLKEAKR